VDQRQNPQAASDAPRWRVLAGRRLAVEASLSAATLQALLELGHDVNVTPPDQSFGFGGAQLVWRDEEGYVAGSDHRKDGQAVGY